MDTITHNGHTFQLIDYVPVGYEIWNIGKNMVDGYLPLCRMSAVRQPFPGCREIETDTLKAIPCEGAQVILSAVGCGHDTPKKMEAYIQKHNHEKPGTRAYEEVQKCKAALPFMRQIKWH